MALWRMRTREGFQLRSRLRQSLGRWRFNRKLSTWRRLRDYTALRQREAALVGNFQHKADDLQDLIEAETSEKQRLERKAEMSIKVAQVERAARERAEEERDTVLKRAEAECHAVEVKCARANDDMEQELAAAREGMSAQVKRLLDQQQRELEASRRAKGIAEKRRGEAEALAGEARQELELRGKVSALCEQRLLKP